MIRVPYSISGAPSGEGDGYVYVESLIRPYSFALFVDAELGDGGMAAVDYGEEDENTVCLSTQKVYEDTTSRREL